MLISLKITFSANGLLVGLLAGSDNNGSIGLSTVDDLICLAVLSRDEHNCMCSKRHYIVLTIMMSPR